jgi:signal transduction histidine kinase/ActR/RegA family two-component response regulator
MTDKKSVSFWLFVLLGGLWLALLAGSLVWLLVQNNAQQGRQNRLWLAYYSNSVAANLAQRDAESAGPELLRLLQVPGLRQVCVYLDQALAIQLVATAETCAEHLGGETVRPPEREGVTVQIPFLSRDGRAGHLILHTDDPRPALMPLAGLLCLFIVSLGIAAAFFARLYLRRQQEFLQAQPLRELKDLCQTLYQTQNYRLRAKDYPKSPYKMIARMLNQMLEELQTNENELQEYAVQIQEKNDQLAAQKRLHQDRNQNLKKMFAGASHDLRQPLQAMIIFVGAIKEYATPKQEPLIQKLEQVVDNLNHLFTDLLDISKLESRMTRVPKENLSLQPLLAKIYDEFEALANEKRITLRLYNRDLTVYSNPNMLERIIRNMISNAIRYTRTGGVLIGCRKRQNAVWIEVWDTGRGIPQEKMGEIFNEFVQIKDEDSEPSKGVGLGLFIVKHLAQLLDHSIIVTSQLRRGTMFRVVAPAQALGAPVAEIQRVAAPIAVAAPPLALSPEIPRKILLLDDDDEVRLALKQLLESWGCEVREWDRLEDAENTLRQESVEFDLIISDFQLEPTCNGLEAIAALRQLLGAEIPALLITGTTEPELLDQIERSQIPFLRKPVRPAKLRALLQALADKS